MLLVYLLKQVRWGGFLWKNYLWNFTLLLVKCKNEMLFAWCSLLITEADPVVKLIKKQFCCTAVLNLFEEEST